MPTGAHEPQLEHDHRPEARRGHPHHVLDQGLQPLPLPPIVLPLPEALAAVHGLGAPAGRLSRVAHGTAARGDPIMHVPVRLPCRDRGHPLAWDPPLPLASDALYRAGTRPSRPRLDRGRSQPPPPRRVVQRQATGKDAPLALRDAHGWCPATTTRPISPVISALKAPRSPVITDCARHGRVVQIPMVLMARAARTMTTSSEMADCVISSTLARRESTSVSVGLKAVAVLKATNR